MEQFEQRLRSLEEKSSTFPKQNVVLNQPRPYRMKGANIVAIRKRLHLTQAAFARLLNGLLRPDSGTVLLEGRDIWQKPREIGKVRSRVGMVFQYPEYQLFAETVYKDIAFGPTNMGITGDELDRRVREAAAFCGLGEDELSASPFDISGGQKPCRLSCQQRRYACDNISQHGGYRTHGGLYPRARRRQTRGVRYRPRNIP